MGRDLAKKNPRGQSKAEPEGIIQWAKGGYSQIGIDPQQVNKFGIDRGRGTSVSKSAYGTMTSQVLDQSLIEKLNQYRTKTGNSFGDFHFEPGTGNWWYGAKGIK